MVEARSGGSEEYRVAPARAAHAVSDLAFFAINLDRSKDRWAALSRGFADVPWPLYRVAALDAAENPESVLTARGQSLALPPAGVGWNSLRNRLFSLVEEACFASHLIALKMFLDSPHKYGVILEDDAMPMPALEEVLRRLLGSGQLFDIVKLEGSMRRGRRPAVLVAELGSTGLVRSLQPSSGSAGYLVTRSAAARLIERAGMLMAPVDDYISNPGLHGCDVMHVSPWLILQARDGSTMRGQRRPNRHIKRRDSWRFLQQGLARGGLRLQLWRQALKGLPISRLRLSPWWPKGFRRKLLNKLIWSDDK
jgi:GR25 family glycosyltransferase involved in LPS biosynthesis